MPELKQLMEHMNAARSRAGKAMWSMVLADTVLDMLSREQPITRSTLVAKLKRKAAFEGNSDNLKDAYLQAAHLIEFGAEAPAAPVS